MEAEIIPITEEKIPLLDDSESSVKLSKNDLQKKKSGKKLANPRGPTNFFVALMRWVWKEIPTNLRAGITVSLVNVPLSISLSIAGGGSPVPGVVTAFWAGLAAAFVGGSEFNIVGPTGALSGLLAATTATYGVSILPFLAINAGLMSFIVWLFNLVDYILFIPSSVIHGFTIGVGFIIAFNQMDSAFGLTFQHEEKELYLKVWESCLHFGETNWAVLVLFVLQTAALFFLGKKWPKFPWAILITILGIVLSVLCVHNILPFKLVTLLDKYGELRLDIFEFPAGNKDAFSWPILSASISVTFIAILETLISAKIADDMTKTNHNRQREVLSMFVSNVVAGICGGIPATAALARTSLNIQTGATSRISAIIGCLSMLLLSFVFLPFFKYLPMTTIAALLVVVAIKMINVQTMVHLYHHDRSGLFILILSAAVCFFIDTVAGLVVGGLLSLLLSTKEMAVGHAEVEIHREGDLLGQVDIEALSKIELASPIGPSAIQNELEGDIEDSSMTHGHKFLPIVKRSSSFMIAPKPGDEDQQPEQQANVMVYRILGPLTYVSAPNHVLRVKKLVEKAQNVECVIILLRSLSHIDLDGVDALKEMIEVFENSKIKVYCAGLVSKEVVHALQNHDFYNDLKVNGRIHATAADVLSHLFPKEQSPEAKMRYE